MFKTKLGAGISVLVGGVMLVLGAQSQAAPIKEVDKDTTKKRNPSVQVIAREKMPTQETTKKRTPSVELVAKQKEATKDDVQKA